MKKEQEDGPDKQIKKKKTVSAFKNTDYRWAFKIIAMTFVISLVFTLVSTQALRNVGYPLAFLIIIIFILIGILFDVVGISVTSVSERPFHSMSARKVKGAVEALKLVRNADKVSNFCNDAVGDIAGIISGATSAIVVSRLVNAFSLNELFTQAIISSVVAGLTVGGKAIGKKMAINYNVEILFFVGRILHFIFKIKNKESQG